MIEVPLTNAPEQLFSIVLRGETYDVRVALNHRLQVWTISFSQLGVSLIDGVAILGGVDILKQHNLPIDNMFVINLDNPNQDPDISEFGVSSKLVMLTDGELLNVSSV